MLCSCNHERERENDLRKEKIKPEVEWGRGKMTEGVGRAGEGGEEEWVRRRLIHLAIAWE